MEEADALCHRVGVLTHGTLRTVANQLKLKGVYGGGYRLNLNLLRENRKLVSQQSLHFGVGNEEIDGDNLRDSIKELVSANSQNEYQAHLIVNQRISSEIKRRFPGAELVKTFNSSLIYQIPLTFKVSDIFLQMKEAEGQLPIADVAITNCSLEDVFINVVALYDKQDGEPWADGDFGRNDIMQGELMSVDALPNEPGPVSDKHSINANSLEKPKPR